MMRLRGMGSGGLRQVERLLDVRPLCPIGHYQNGTCMLLQDETGRVFGVWDDTTVFLGDSVRKLSRTSFQAESPNCSDPRSSRSAGPKRSRGRKGDDRRSLPVVADHGSAVGAPTWSVANVDSRMERVESSVVPVRAFGVKKPTLKAEIQPIPCGLNSLH